VVWLACSGPACLAWPSQVDLFVETELLMQTVPRRAAEGRSGRYRTEPDRRTDGALATPFRAENAAFHLAAIFCGPRRASHAAAPARHYTREYLNKIDGMRNEILTYFTGKLAEKARG